jgi:hypothetical protein
MPDTVLSAAEEAAIQENTDAVLMAGVDAVEDDDEITPEMRGDILNDDGTTKTPEPEKDEEPAPKKEEGVEEEEEGEEEEEAQPDLEDDDGTGELADAVTPDGDGDGDDPDGTPDTTPDKEARIPKSRLDQVIKQRTERDKKIAEQQAEIDRLTAGGKPDQPQASQQEALDAERAALDAEIVKWERQADEATVDGEFDRASQLRSHIRKMDRAMTRKEAQHDAAITTQLTKESMTFDATVESVYAEYPCFDPSSGEDVYDQALTDEVSALQAGYLSKGVPQAAAVKQAVAMVAKMYDLVATSAEAEVEVEEEEVETPTQKKVAAKKAAKKKVPVKAKVKAANQQPPTMQNGGDGDEAVIDIDKLTDEEFDALPLSKQRALRGDVVTV